jgi:esterase
VGDNSVLLNYGRMGDGEPLIILHGLFGSSKNWQSLAKVFSNHFDVLTLDLRNHGGSFHDDVMDYPAMVDDIYRLLRHLDIKSCRVIGHSMGGKVGMLLALEYPQLLSQLVVADIAPITYSHSYDHIIDPVLGLNLNEMESRTAVDRALQKHIPDLQLRQFLLQSLMRDSDCWRWKINWLAIKQNIDKIMSFPYLAESLQGKNSQQNSWLVRTPTLFINGDNSEFVDQKGKAAIHQHFESAQFEILSNAGHWLHAEQPQQFSKAILNFL